MRNAEKDREIIAEIRKHTGITVANKAWEHYLERTVSAEQRVAELEEKLSEAIKQIEYMRDNIPTELWSYKDHDEWGNRADKVIEDLKGGKDLD